jgi:uncharacterized protein (DUF2147 family)
MRKFGYLTALAVLVSAGPALASPVGEWVAENDGTRIEISQCGAVFCGKPVGSSGTVNFDLRRVGDIWRGRAFRDDETHPVTMSLADEKRLVVKGCLGLFCIEQVWRRVH